MQCRAEQELARLAEAAGGLCSVLIDETLGACKPGLPDGRVILSGEDLTADDINEKVRIAIRHAGENDATLVLAFLGHGFVPGQVPTLYLMAPESAASSGDYATVEHLALCYPVSDGTCRTQLARFVVALAVEAGRDIEAQELREWATSVEGIVELNNAVEALRQRDDVRRVRLIVSLHVSLAGDWPDTIVAWLLHAGKMYERTEIPCEPDKLGVESALIDAVDWAEDHARKLGLMLRHVDVAVPTALLLRWRPEEVAYVQRLGLEYEVVTRWSDRLKRSKAMARAINHAARRLAEIAACATVAPVDWLDSHDLADLAQLRDQLVNGRYSKALALASRPRDAEDLMALLLTHSPIVLWPHVVDEFPEERRGCLATCWHRMPGEFLTMYRMRWRDEPTGDAGDLRAVWDDEDWLNFCRSFQYGESANSGSTS